MAQTRPADVGQEVSQQEKLSQRFLAKPKDFTWSELKTLLGSFGYQEASGGKTGGSRRRFTHASRAPIMLHKSHPDETLKAYQVTQIITFLRVERLI
jgi:hypothetical protein